MASTDQQFVQRRAATRLRLAPRLLLLTLIGAATTNARGEICSEPWSPYPSEEWSPYPSEVWSPDPSSAWTAPAADDTATTESPIYVAELPGDRPPDGEQPAAAGGSCFDAPPLN